MNTKITIFSKISNYFFIFSIVFILSFIWTNYYNHKIINSLILAILITFLSIIIYTPIKIKINKNQKLNINKQRIKDNIKSQLLYGNLQYNVSYLLALFNINIIEKINPTHYISEKNEDIIFILEDDQIDKHIKYCNKEKIIIFTINNNLLFEYPNKTIEIYNYLDIYTQITKLNSLPVISVNTEKSRKYSAKDIFRIILNKHQAKQYFQMGILTLFLSLFTLFPIYYIVIGTILIILSVISKFNYKYNH